MKKFIERALEVIEEEIIPETKNAVAKGNKVFGGQSSYLPIKIKIMVMLLHHMDQSVFL